MEFLDALALGFGTAVTPENLLFCLIGALLGTLIGVLPGIGPTATLAILLPITFFLPPLSALIMLSGIFYGAQYGGSTTAILVNLPGEASSVVTALDGYEMAKQGRAGSALAIAALGSFFAGTVATVGLAVAGPTLASFAISVEIDIVDPRAVLGDHLEMRRGADDRLGDLPRPHDKSLDRQFRREFGDLLRGGIGSAVMGLDIAPAQERDRLFGEGCACHEHVPCPAAFGWRGRLTFLVSFKHLMSPCQGMPGQTGFPTAPASDGPSSHPAR